MHVFPTCAKPSSADRLSNAGVAGKCSPASAAAICPGVKPCENKTQRQSNRPPYKDKNETHLLLLQPVRREPVIQPIVVLGRVRRLGEVLDPFR